DGRPAGLAADPEPDPDPLLRYRRVRGPVDRHVWRIGRPRGRPALAGAAPGARGGGRGGLRYRAPQRARGPPRGDGPARRVGPGRASWSAAGWDPPDGLAREFPAASVAASAPTWALVVALLLGTAAALVVGAGRWRGRLSPALSAATTGALLAIFNTASEVG